MMQQSGGETLVQSLAKLLRDSGHTVLNGASTLTLLTSSLQHLTLLFEQHLQSRKHQHGFIALPSHPADSAVILQIQFLFDVLQKTISLKLVNPMGCRLQSAVKIFPFKSLKCLELKRVPPHCLEGLRLVYSQLEVLICTQCIDSLQEIISVCGGDLSSALPWLELHTLKFSYNSLAALDNSLLLLNVLKTLDLSHNKISDCAEYLTALTELEYLNLGYNVLQRVPDLSLSSKVKLVTLILRNNELEAINGVEQLSNLQHLDLGYNLLLEHAQLAPLSLLHKLKKHIPKPGQLIGWALRTATSSSVDAACLDQSLLEASHSGELTDSISPVEGTGASLPHKKSKSKIKVRTASISEASDVEHGPIISSASISVALFHQSEIERMDSFRDQLGEEWLQYKHHLEVAPVWDSNTSKGQQGAPDLGNLSESQELDSSLGVYHHSSTEVLSEDTDEALDKEETDKENERVYTLAATSTLMGESAVQESDRTEMHSTAPPVEEEDDDLEVDLCHPLVVGLESELEDVPNKSEGLRIFLQVKAQHVLELDLHNAKVLQKLDLDSLLSIKKSEVSWKDSEQMLPALELRFDYIRKDRQRRRYVMLDDDPDQALQVLTEVLSKALEENQNRDQREEAESTRLQCLKCKLEFLAPKEEDCKSIFQSSEGIGVNGEGELGGSMEAPGTGVPPLVCPACLSNHVIVVPVVSDMNRVTSTPHSSSHHSTDTSILHIAFVDTEQMGSLKNEFSHEVPDGLADTLQSSEFQTRAPVLRNLDLSIPLENGVEVLAKGGSFFIGGDEDSSEFETSQGSRILDQSYGDFTEESGHLNFRTAWYESKRSGSHPTLEHISSSWRKNSLPSQRESETRSTCGSLAGSYLYETPSAPTLSQLSTPSEFSEENTQNSVVLSVSTEDFASVDHRLKLFLDMEVFEDNLEEFQGFIKASTVKYGKAEEFPSLLVVSDQRLYILEIVQEIRGQPSDWLRKTESHYIPDLLYLEVGLGSQSIRIQFDGPGASYTLLIRHRGRCERFFQYLTGIVRELASKQESKLQAITTARVGPQHHFWPLICENAASEQSDERQLDFFYLLAFLVQEGSSSSVTLLATRSTLYLLEEDHQWRKSSSTGEANGSEEPEEEMAKIQETQLISSVSSVHLYQSAPCDIKLKLYNETLKTESSWHLRTDSPDLINDLVEWIRLPWEEMFGVRLNTVIHQRLD
nr:PREDICTED: serine/threonine-protein kinase 11-interacting protein [Latimeria chalumnae]|eukprot:XP_005991831.1 PREDICTED: serine/threonine-protein kinase 11-interacting protein [Latimeria chalumnae]